jgi:hypothetical protein
MNRKIRLASAVTLAGFLFASAPLAASAGTPLLSGYGGPGAGEQAIVGSTLLGGPNGAAAAGGPPGSAESAGTGHSGSRGSLPGGGLSSTGAGDGRVGSRGSSNARSDGVVRAGTPAGHAGTTAFVYPNSLRSASASSPPLGLSGGDLVLLAGMVAILALVGTLTIRLSRLQH